MFLKKISSMMQFEKTNDYIFATFFIAIFLSERKKKFDK